MAFLDAINGHEAHYLGDPYERGAARSRRSTGRRRAHRTTEGASDQKLRNANDEQSSLHGRSVT